MTSKTVLMALSTLAALAIGASAHATEFVQNGGFEGTDFAGSAQFGTDGGWTGHDVTGWTTNGYNFVYTPGTADTSGANGHDGNVGLYGPGNGHANGLPATSPAGGNFVASDPSFEIGSIDQSISGLTIGSTYTLTFDWAGAQQTGFTGDTTEGWKVTLGDSAIQSTGTLGIGTAGFTGWQTATMTFTADQTTEVLSFLATGGPSGTQPPFALLDGVSLTGGVPEPAAWSLMLIGFGGIGAAIRRRRPALAAAA